MGTKKIKILFLISVSVFLTYLFILLKHYPEIADVVTTHVDMRGEADKLGGKINLIYASLVNLVVLLLMGYLIRNPHLPNYPVEITEENKSSAYKGMQIFLALIAIVTSCAFAYMIFNAIGLLHYYLHFILILVFIPLGAVIFFRSGIKD